MSKVPRRLLPALFMLTIVIYGCEPSAAQQLRPQASVPAIPEISSSHDPNNSPATAPASATTADAADPLTARRADGRDDQAINKEEARRHASDNSTSSSRRLATFVADIRGTPGAEQVFGYNAPAFAAEAVATRDQSQSDRPAQQQGGQQTGAQQPGNQPQDPNQPDAIQPLTSGQKMRRAFRGAFLSPTPYAFSAFSATLTQVREKELPDKDFEDEFGDWASRFARTFATRTTRSIFTNGVYASLFRQDPRYHRPTNKGFGARLAYAVSRVFVTRDDDGNTEPNYSRFAGAMTASALANVWERSTPGHDRIGTDATLRRFGLYFVYDAASNVVFREILPTVFGR